MKSGTTYIFLDRLRKWKILSFHLGNFLKMIKAFNVQSLVDKSQGKFSVSATKNESGSLWNIKPMIELLMGWNSDENLWTEEIFGRIRNWVMAPFSSASTLIISLVRNTLSWLRQMELTIFEKYCVWGRENALVSKSFVSYSCVLLCLLVDHLAKLSEIKPLVLGFVICFLLLHILHLFACENGT